MNKIIAKPVGMFELFYDLVFVYAISRITAMIHHPIAGKIPLITYLQFLLVVIVVMQIWLYQTLYFNRYSKNRLIDIAGLLINMFTAVYLANNINTEWRITFLYFNIAMAVMVGALFLQYLFGGVKSADNQSFLLTLGIEFILIVVGVMIGYPTGMIFCIAGALVGFLFPLVISKRFDPEKINFPHLVERVGLIVIIAFGEAIVNLATYFNKNEPIIHPVLLFLSLVLMFASYVTFSEKIINHHQYSKGFVLMYSHIVIVVAILMITVVTIYLNLKHVDSNFLNFLIISTIGIYYLAVFVNFYYSKSQCQLSSKDILSLLLIYIAGAIIVLVLKGSKIGMMFILFIWNLAFYLFVLIKARRLSKNK